MSTNHFILLKENTKTGPIKQDKKIKGYKFKPKNNVKCGGVKIRQMILVKPSMVTKVLMKKTRRKLEMFLKNIMELLDDEDSGTTDLKLALNELYKFKMTLKNNYKEYLEKEFYTTMIKRIKVLETELKNKTILLNLAGLDEKETTKSGRRR